MTVPDLDLRHPGKVFAARTFEAVLFDMDGTLIDSGASISRCWRRWAAEFDLPEPEKFQVRHGVPASLVVPSLLPPERVEAGLARIMELELTDTKGTRILPGVAQMLQLLPAHRAAIVTSCTRDLAQARITAAGLTPPATVVTADDVERGKPYPDPFRLGAQRLGVDPARCLVVEDAPAGVRSGLDAGCAVLAVGGTHELSALQEADAQVSGLDQVQFAVEVDGVRLSAS